MNNDTQPDALRLALQKVRNAKIVRPEVAWVILEETEQILEKAIAELDLLRQENLRLQMLCDTDKASADHWRAECEKLRQAQGGEAVACLVGMKGSAFDSPKTKRAYTYAEQPGNVVASKLGRATAVAAIRPGGDSIDAGLSLLNALQAEGFGVFDLGAEYASPPLQADACKVPQLDAVRKWADGWANIPYEDPWKFAAQEILSLLSASPAAPTQVTQRRAAPDAAVPSAPSPSVSLQFEFGGVGAAPTQESKT